MPKKSNKTEVDSDDEESTDYHSNLLLSDDDDDDSSDDEPPKRMPPATRKKAARTTTPIKSNRKQVKMAGDPPVDESTAPLLTLAELGTRNQQVHSETKVFSSSDGFFIYFLFVNKFVLTPLY